MQIMLKEYNRGNSMDPKKPKLPKDLGIKIGTPREVLWTNVKKNALMAIKQNKNEIEIQEELLKVAKNKILLEQRK